VKTNTIARIVWAFLGILVGAFYYWASNYWVLGDVIGLTLGLLVRGAWVHVIYFLPIPISIFLATAIGFRKWKLVAISSALAVFYPLILLGLLFLQ
jgi:hypothetical protein